MLSVSTPSVPTAVHPISLKSVTDIMALTTETAKALELFMISLVTKSADLARAGNSKRVTAVHLKKTIEGDEQFDFLNDIVAKVADQPDAGQEKGKGRKKEESESGEDEKPKKKGRRKKGE